MTYATTYKCKIKTKCQGREFTRLSTYLVSGPTPVLLIIYSNLHMLVLWGTGLQNLFLFRCCKNSREPREGPPVFKEKANQKSLYPY